MTDALLGIILICSAFIAAAIAYRIYKWLLKKTAKTDTLLDDLLVQSCGKPLIVLIFIVPVIIALNFYLPLPPGISWILDSKFILVLYTIIGTWMVATFVDNLILTYGHWLAAHSEGALDERIVDLLEMLVKYVILFIGLLIIFHILDVDVTPLLAGAGIAGLAAALAVKDILGNVLGGAMLIMDKPFKEHDRIQIDKYYGDVVQVGSRSMRMITPDSQVVTIPNSLVTTSVIVNYSLPDSKIRLKLPFSVAYQTNLDRVRSVITEIIKKESETVPNLLSDPAPEILITGFGDSGVDMVIQVWSDNPVREPQLKNILYDALYKRFADEGIEIPFNQMDVRVKS